MCVNVGERAPCWALPREGSWSRMSAVLRPFSGRGPSLRDLQRRVLRLGRIRRARSLFLVSTGCAASLERDPPLLSPANPVKAEAGSPDPSRRMGPSRYQEGACALPSAPTPRPHVYRVAPLRLRSDRSARRRQGEARSARHVAVGQERCDCLLQGPGARLASVHPEHGPLDVMVCNRGEAARPTVRGGRTGGRLLRGGEGACLFLDENYRKGGWLEGRRSALRNSYLPSRRTSL